MSRSEIEGDVVVFYNYSVSIGSERFQVRDNKRPHLFFHMATLDCERALGVCRFVEITQNFLVRV